MATRGHLGGLSRATGDAALVLDAAGKDVVIIETVGVGQDEVEIVRTADVSIVTLVPGAGDEVQALKAGIMEIADIFVVNKADREGADRLVAAVEANLACRRTLPGSGVRRSSRRSRRAATGWPSSSRRSGRSAGPAKCPARPRRAGVRAPSISCASWSRADSWTSWSERAGARRADGGGGQDRGTRARSVHRRSGLLRGELWAPAP